MDETDDPRRPVRRHVLTTMSALAAGAVLPPLAALAAPADKPAGEGGSRTILVTGSTNGAGRRVAERLAGPGTTVLVHGRNRERAEEVLAAIRTAGGEGRFYPADFAALAEVRGLAEALARDCPRLDVLINNAGIGTGRPGEGRQTSKDGYEMRFAVNYLAPFLLTRRLAPLLRTSRPARIVNVASSGQNQIEFDDVMLTRGYGGQRAYGQSKLALIMFTFDLAQELAGTGVTANCLHPATYMDTAMVRESGISPWSSVDEGAAAILHLAVGPDMAERTGLYYDGLQPAHASSQAYDREARARLRALSLQLTGS
ncbi:NAD(P)-dependent dehydrogenase, short-chain alcohol dehydrogenase family [Enhydrobacter aerosaccus]|uniref:NAD(P)-dependent dehydrogenase, short-chain alcohol dehydrogenase family n=1 Tax=Enhydrobacter aerosaccus TaxID=225324 RepID=A0A1T4SRX9_9HYPH|nr:SDR family NAD(P)-dependent oxidoreductase [Enhydrobacter aerosaccus]SKA30995.1 NAD(P)-dependent dehydrogenase, short-chain alcohol dehydrogenase family [Enhydrobacter aerosaccus]